MARAAKAQPGGKPDIWLAAGMRTPFTKAGGALAKRDAFDLSVPVVNAILAQLPKEGARGSSARR